MRQDTYEWSDDTSTQRDGVVIRLWRKSMILPLVAAFAVLSTGAVLAISAIVGDDSATFESTITNSRTHREHLLNVDGSGQLTALLTDRTKGDTPVTYKVTLATEEGKTLSSVKSVDGTARLVHQISPGVYKFRVGGEGSLPAEGASYSLSLTYPNETLSLSAMPEKSDKTTKDVDPKSPEATKSSKSRKKPTSNNAATTQPSGTSDSAATPVASESSMEDNTGESTDDSADHSSMDQSAPAPTRTNGSAGNAFSEDFNAPGWQSRFDRRIDHRDDHVVSQTSWIGDHAPVSGGVEDNCSIPGYDDENFRTIQRGDRASGFNEQWIYRCAPLNMPELGHLMTSIGDTSGYSIGAFSPKSVFNNVREVRWEVNQTDLGDRKWTEVAIVPESRFSFENLPCHVNVPCDRATHDQLGSVGTQWGGQRVRVILTDDMPTGYTQGIQPGTYRCETCPGYVSGKRLGSAYGQNDMAALTDTKPRRRNFFRDNGNGTLTWGYEACTANCEFGADNPQFEWDEFTVPGEFPSGNVRVVFKDHNYTPLKSGAELTPRQTFTWHWDNLEVDTQ